MDLSRYDALGEELPADLKSRYQAMHTELRRLCAADPKDMKAIDAVMVELDELQAGARNAQKREGDPQRF